MLNLSRYAESEIWVIKTARHTVVVINNFRHSLPFHVTMAKVRKARRKATSPSIPFSTDDYDAATQAAINEHYLRPKTVSAYSSYMKQIRRFWEDHLNQHKSHSDEDANALKTLNSSTPKVLRYFIIKKCRNEGKGFSTAEGARSAFKEFSIEYVDIPGRSVSLRSNCRSLSENLDARVQYLLGSITKLLSVGVEIQY